MGREHDDGQLTALRVVGVQAAQGFQAIDAAHPQVEQDEVEPAAFPGAVLVQPRQGRLAGSDLHGFVAKVSQGFGEPFAESRVVINDQDGSHEREFRC